MYKYNYNKSVQLMINIIISFLFVLCFSYSTSPIYQELDGDQAMFVLIGRGIRDGIIPYKDLLENKGPLFFLLQAIPQFLLTGTTGIYVLQSLILSVECCVLDAIAGEFKLKQKQILKLFLFIPLMIIYTRGDKAEEYDLFFLIICLLLFVKSIKADIDCTCKKIYKYSFLYGVFTGAVLFIKMNDAASALVMCVLSCINGIKRNMTKKKIISYISFYVGYWLCGIGVSFLLSNLYYIVNGAFNDMIYGYIILNFSMVSEGGVFSSLIERCKMLFSPYGLFSVIPIFIIVLYGMILSEKNKRDRSMILGFLIISAFASMMTYTHTTGFLPHLIPAVIIWIIAGICLLDRLKNNGNLFNWITVILALIYLFGYLYAGLKNTDGLINTNVVWKQQKEEDSLINYIPKDDYNNVYIIGKVNSWYYENHIYPFYRYLNLENFIRHMGKRVAIDFETDLVNTPVKWLILTKDLEKYHGILTNKSLEFVKENYKLYRKVDYYCIYKRIY